MSLAKYRPPIVILSVALVLSLSVFLTQGAKAASPKVAECTTWATVQTINVNHSFGVSQYSGYVKLQKLIAFPSGDTSYCGALRAVAHLQSVTGSITASVQGFLHWRPGTSGAYSLDAGPKLTVGTGGSQNSWAPNTTGRDAACGFAEGTFTFPDVTQGFSTTPNCPV